MVQKRGLANQKGLSSIQIDRQEWSKQLPLKPPIDVFKWVEAHQQELATNISKHPNFLAACGEANVTPQKKFAELMEFFLHPSEFFWMEFRSMLKHSLAVHSMQLANSKEAQTQFIENALFSSFSRIIRQSNPKRLA